MNGIWKKAVEHCRNKVGRGTATAHEERHERNDCIDTDAFKQWTKYAEDHQRTHVPAIPAKRLPERLESVFHRLLQL